MALPQWFKDVIKEKLDGENGLNKYVNDIIEQREDLLALLRLDANIPEENCWIIVQSCRAKLVAAAIAIQNLLADE